MPKFILSKKVRLIGGLILFGSLYAFHFRKVDSPVYEISVDEELINTPTAAPIKDIPMVFSEDALYFRDTPIFLGDSSKQVIEALGIPSRIDATKDGFDYYIYNNDYSRMAFIAVKENKVVGFYTDSRDFSFLHIRFGDDIAKINRALGQNYSEAAVLTYETDNFIIKILMDELEAHTVTGIYVLSKDIASVSEEKNIQYTDTVISNIEQISYDLINSIRKRHELPPLSWSSSAAIAARKHSIAMADKGFFSHIDPELRTPEGRLLAEGIGYRVCSENIIGGYGDAILTSHALYNSNRQRRNILSKEYRYVGVGFAYDEKSIYHSYYTQVLYR